MERIYSRLRRRMHAVQRPPRARRLFPTAFCSYRSVWFGWQLLARSCEARISHGQGRLTALLPVIPQRPRRPSNAPCVGTHCRHCARHSLTSCEATAVEPASNTSFSTAQKGGEPDHGCTLQRTTNRGAAVPRACRSRARALDLAASSRRRSTPAPATTVSARSVHASGAARSRRGQSRGTSR